jgi:hypothetical protein
MLDTGDCVGVHSTFYEGNMHRSLQNDRQVRESGAGTSDKKHFF